MGNIAFKKKPALRSLLCGLLALSLLMGVLPVYASPAPAGDSLRVYYQNDANDYQGLGLWFWGDVQSPSEQAGAWPGGRTPFPAGNITPDYAFLDIPLSENPGEVGILVIDGMGTKHTPEDVLIPLTSPLMRQVWVNERLQVFPENQRAIPENHLRIRYHAPDETYDNLAVWSWGDVLIPSEQAGAWPLGATLLSIEAGPLGAYVDLPLVADAKEVGFLFVNVETSEQTMDYKARPGEARVVYMKAGDDNMYQNPYQTSAAQEEASTHIPWQQIDQDYATLQPLGASLDKDGQPTLRLFAPTADLVEAVIYHKDDQASIHLDHIAMEKDQQGVWSTTILEDLTGYFYQFRVHRGQEATLVLDPYANSMAAWDSSRGEKVGKAALVDPRAIGPSLSFASIPGFEKREDAIIYEAHVRDFTSDPAIAGQLSAPYGGFLAFIERLDYIKDLGVTHIQLLPVLNYYHVNELDRSRSPQYAAGNQNYNWGYDPHSYFALTGMYATRPEDPQNRILEFKLLVDAIHQRGMGVILDVVYNHTATIDLLEDIQPNYYYFMDSKGRPKGSFGGGQVGSTHAMARRLIVDSLVYLTEVYQVDGFRFDMMGSLDAHTIQQAYDQVASRNPHSLFVGEGWRTYNGDFGEVYVQPADQDWMNQTDDVSVFSDEIRNELKSGFGSEGQPRFLTTGPRPIPTIFRNIKAQPGNVLADDPGDILQYIEAHDNLTLFDVIAYSIKRDPALHSDEILRRVRLGNALLLTSQGLIFLHSGQEYGRTKQFLHPDYTSRVASPPDKSTFMVDGDGQPFLHPYFIHDSYDASDAVNRFDWEKATQEGPHRHTVDYTRGLIALRKASDAFRLATSREVDQHLQLIDSPSIQTVDLLLAYTATSPSTGEVYLVIFNADDRQRSLDLSKYSFDLAKAQVLVDGQSAGTSPIQQPQGLHLLPGPQGQHIHSIDLEALTAVVIRFPAR